MKIDVFGHLADQQMPSIWQLFQHPDQDHINLNSLQLRDALIQQTDEAFELGKLEFLLTKRAAYLQISADKIS